MRLRPGGEQTEPVYRITGARRSLTEDIRVRQRRYTISMLIRVVAVIATVLLWDVSTPLALATLALGTVIPYVAVVMANGGREGARPMPVVRLDEPAVRALPGKVVEGEATTAADADGPTDRVT